MDRRPPTFEIGGRYDLSTGAFFIVPALLGAAVAEIPITAAVLAPVAAGFGALLAGAAAINATALVASSLWKWATAPSDGSTRVGDERIAEERQSLGFEPGATHIAVCGVAGSGKSSLVSALRGLDPTAPGAAATGNAETTTARTKYATHASIQGISLQGVFLHDLPGSGTIRVTAVDYYHRMQLYLFDHVFIVQGARFGETDAEIIRSCVVQGQRFTVIRSQMDILINTMIEDSDGAISNAVAKGRVRADCAAGVVEEMKRAGLPPEAMESLLPLCALVNKHDLRRLTVQDPAHWPQPRGPREMMEREILRALGKAGVGNDALSVA